MKPDGKHVRCMLWSILYLATFFKFFCSLRCDVFNILSFKKLQYDHLNPLLRKVWPERLKKIRLLSKIERHNMLREIPLKLLNRIVHIACKKTKVMQRTINVKIILGLFLSCYDRLQIRNVQFPWKQKNEK